jgi:hypothetical protein
LTAIDESDSLVSVGIDQGLGVANGYYLGRFDRSGTLLWATLLPGAVASGPVLGDGQQAFMLSSDVDAGAVSLSTLTLATGSSISMSFPLTASTTAIPGLLEHPMPLQLLLTASGSVVFNTGTQVYGIASGGQRPPAASPWPTPAGQPDQREAALGQ